MGASWFETRGDAALLTMRISNLILKRRDSAVSKDEPRALNHANADRQWPFMLFSS
jgi:hypothetical protein